MAALQAAIAKNNEGLSLLSEREAKRADSDSLTKRADGLRAHIAEIDKLQAPGPDAPAMPDHVQDFKGTAREQAAACSLLGMKDCPDAGPR